MENYYENETQKTETLGNGTQGNEIGKKKTGMATASLVLGILALITTLALINYIFALVAIVLGLVFLLVEKREAGRIRAAVGVGLSIFSIAISSWLWWSVCDYIFNTPVTEIVEDIKYFTGGEVDIEQMADEVIENYIAEAVAPETMEKVEELLGQKVSYTAIKEFVGEAVSVNRIRAFIGDSEIKAEDIQKLADTVDAKALIEDLGGKVTFEAIEEKVGEDFTYEDLLDYVEQFVK